MIDQLKCMSLKNKKSSLQCPNRRQKNSEYCGKHKNNINIVRIDTKISVDTNPPNVEKITTKKIKIQCPYTTGKILSCNNFNNLSIKRLRLTIKDLKSTEMVPLLGNTKRDIYSHLYEYMSMKDYYVSNVDKLIKSQSCVRRYLVQKRSKCVNDDDICTTQNKYDIPFRYYFDFTDEKGFTYCFDIRSFAKLLESSEPTNPYTMELIPKMAIEKFKKRTINNNILLTFDKEEVTQEQSFKHYMVEIFHKYDMLDNYTDHTWFSELSLTQLKDLYHTAEDVWNYRSQLMEEHKKRIVKSGIAFNIPLHEINSFKNNNIRQLQMILLKEFDRFVTEGTDINEKKLGAMLMLTALVEVSVQAGNALPHLIQYIG